MGIILEMLKDYQAVNIAEGGISFAEEAFTQLHDEVLKSLDEATVVSFMLGVALTGGAVAGIWTSITLRKKLKNRNKKEA